ncbi:MAG: hypothetical protein NVS2B12_15340 [Ktedonobacteraceae bacterium]
MYIYYILHGAQGEEPVELEGDLSEELLPGIDLSDGPITINALVEQLRTTGNTTAWETCDLTNDFFDREDNYIFFHGRWIRRSDAPWRKDRNN